MQEICTHVTTHPHALATLVFTFTLFALLCCELFCYLTELDEERLLIRGSFSAEDVSFFAMFYFEDVGHS